MIRKMSMLLLSIVLFLVHSANVEGKSNSRIYDASYDKVWIAAIKVLATRGYTVLDKDKDAGIFFTDFRIDKKEEQKIRSWVARHKLNIIVQKKTNSETEVEIIPSFEIKSEGGIFSGKDSNREWQQWPPGKARNAAQADLESAILDDIGKFL